MSHWAEIDEDNIVVRVLVGNNSEPDEGEAFMNSLGGTWVKTSYTGSIRKNFAGIGFEFRSAIDAFVPPQPFPSWTLNEDTAQWESPVPYPEDGIMYQWNEELTDWQATIND
jgi:hypothetical protein